MFIVPFQEKNGQKPLFFDFQSAEITPEHSGLEIHASEPPAWISTLAKSLPDISSMVPCGLISHIIFHLHLQKQRVFVLSVKQLIIVNIV